MAPIRTTSSGPRRHFCILCGYRTSRHFDFQRHCRETHSDSRPYECPFEGCGHTAKQLAHLKTHWRQKHCGDEGKLYGCVGCELWFADRSARDRHCIKCGKANKEDRDDNLPYPWTLQHNVQNTQQAGFFAAAAAVAPPPPNITEAPTGALHDHHHDGPADVPLDVPLDAFDTAAQPLIPREDLRGLCEYTYNGWNPETLDPRLRRDSGYESGQITPDEKPVQLEASTQCPPPIDNAPPACSWNMDPQFDSFAPFEGIGPCPPLFDNTTPEFPSDTDPRCVMSAPFEDYSQCQPLFNNTAPALSWDADPKFDSLALPEEDLQNPSLNDSAAPVCDLEAAWNASLDQNPLTPEQLEDINAMFRD